MSNWDELIALTRTYYYDGELLLQEDFIRDQQYFRDVTGWTNIHLMTPGVVGGLEPIDKGDSEFVLSAGLAVDDMGRPIAQLVETNLSDYLQSGSPDGWYKIIVKYGSDWTDGDTTGLEQSHTITEIPVITLALIPPSGSILAGQVEIVSEEIVGVNIAGRTISTLKLAALPSPPPIAATDAKAGGALMLGDPLQGPGKPAAAAFSVGVGGTARADAAAVASFGFEDGEAGGTVSIGTSPVSGATALLDLAYGGKRIWTVDQDGALHVAAEASSAADAAPVADALATLRALDGVAFTAPSGRRRLGVLAETVEKVLPDLVRTDDGGAKSVAMLELIGLLVEAVKTLSDRVEQLEKPPARRAARKS